MKEPLASEAWKKMSDGEFLHAFVSAGYVGSSLIDPEDAAYVDKRLRRIGSLLLRKVRK